MHYNTIQALSRIMVKPLAWRICKNSNGFIIEFCYLEPSEKTPLIPIQTSRGATKVYKHISTAIADILKVQPGAAIQLPLEL